MSIRPAPTRRTFRNSMNHRLLHASVAFLLENSDAYRRVSEMDLATEDMNFALLGKASRKK